MSKWINAEKDLPEPELEVLVCVQYAGWEDDEWDIEISSVDGHPNPHFPEMGIWNMGSAENYTVSHWMPLPDYPQD